MAGYNHTLFGVRKRSIIDMNWDIKPNSIMGRLPIRSLNAIKGTRKKIWKSEAKKRIKPNSNSEAPVLIMNRGRMGLIRLGLIDQAVDTNINRYSC